MINKQGLWFLTLFSLILVLSVYYITMPSEIFKNMEIKEETKKDTKKTAEVNSQNTSYTETLKVELDSERKEVIDTLKDVLNDSSKTSEEKNRAYEEMKEINNNKAIEEKIVKKIKEEHSLNSYVKKENMDIEVVIEGKEHDVKLANKIMRTVQKEFDTPMNISIKFS